MQYLLKRQLDRKGKQVLQEWFINKKDEAIITNLYHRSNVYQTIKQHKLPDNSYYC